MTFVSKLTLIRISTKCKHFRINIFFTLWISELKSSRQIKKEINFNENRWDSTLKRSLSRCPVSYFENKIDSFWFCLVLFHICIHHHRRLISVKYFISKRKNWNDQKTKRKERIDLLRIACKNKTAKKKSKYAINLNVTQEINKQNRIKEKKKCLNSRLLNSMISNKQLI